MKKIIFSIFIALIISSCKKEKLNDELWSWYHVNDTIYGTLFKTCNHIPDSNQKVTVVVEGVDIDVGFTITYASAYTDSKGHFSIPLNYSARSSSEPSNTIIYHDSCSVYDWPLNSEHSIVTNDTVHLKINMQVINPLTANDTLFYKFNLSPYNFFTGPFSSGIIEWEVPAWRFRMFKSIDTTENSFYWAVGANNLNSYYNPNAVNERIEVNHVICSLSDTVTMVIK